jgi:hypothetical protein
VESSCEFGTETSGSIKLLGNYRVSKQLEISRVVLSSLELLSSAALWSTKPVTERPTGL